MNEATSRCKGDPNQRDRDGRPSKDSLDFGGVDFWTDRPVSELIAEAGAGPVEHSADLEDLVAVGDAMHLKVYGV